MTDNNKTTLNPVGSMPEEALQLVLNGERAYIGSRAWINNFHAALTYQLHSINLFNFLWHEYRADEPGMYVRAYWTVNNSKEIH